MSPAARKNLLALVIAFGGVAVIISFFLIRDSVTAQNRPAPVEQLTLQCLTVSDGSRADLQRHLLGGTVIKSIAAYPADTGWYVAAVLDDQGRTDVGIWHTAHNPVTSDENAYVSINVTAEVDSDYLSPTWADANHPAAKQAEGCLQ